MQKKHSKNNYEGSLPLTIKFVEPGSIGEELGVAAGDRIIKINNLEVFDELDYYYFTSLDCFTLEILKPDDSILECEVELDESEELGITFFDFLDSKECDNNCIFCFIDQLPPGLRETLYVKDDDERLSFLHGNYVTLTNLTEREIDRICNWRIPLNISVHTTDESLRRKMLANTKANEINSLLKRFYEAQVMMNAQIVLVPDVNDKTLVQSIRDLSQYYPFMQSVSVVPVGVTKYRKGLFPLRVFTQKEGKKIIQEVIKLQKEYEKEFGTPFVYLSDEFYLLADCKIPEAEHYGSFSQLENGVGMITSFVDDFDFALKTIENQKDRLELQNKSYLIITGELFYNTLSNLVNILKEKFPEIKAKVIPVKNQFFGDTVGVAGLLTGEDILKTLEKEESYDTVLIPETTLKNDTTLFLDDLTVEKLSQILDKDIEIVGNNGEEFLKTFFKF